MSGSVPSSKDVAPAAAAASAAAASGQKKVGRPLPGNIHLPPVKKQRTQSKYDPEDDEDDDGATGAGAGVAIDAEGGGGVDSESDVEEAAIPTSVQLAHNTPSPAFFAAAATPTVNQRVTYNPPNPMPPYLTRIRHAKQLVIISSNTKHNARPYKAGKDMDEVRPNTTRHR